jgi:hypothetical protein
MTQRVTWAAPIDTAINEFYPTKMLPQPRSTSQGPPAEDALVERSLFEEA